MSEIPVVTIQKLLKEIYRFASLECVFKSYSGKITDHSYNTSASVVFSSIPKKKVKFCPIRTKLWWNSVRLQLLAEICENLITIHTLFGEISPVFIKLDKQLLLFCWRLVIFQLWLSHPPFFLRTGHVYAAGWDHFLSSIISLQIQWCDPKEQKWHQFCA